MNQHFLQAVSRKTLGCADVPYGTIYAAMSVGGACGSLAGGVLHDATGGYRAVFLMSLAAIALAAEPFRPGGTLAGAIAARRAAPRTPA